MQNMFHYIELFDTPNRTNGNNDILPLIDFEQQCWAPQKAQGKMTIEPNFGVYT